MSEWSEWVQEKSFQLQSHFFTFCDVTCAGKSMAPLSVQVTPAMTPHQARPLRSCRAHSCEPTSVTGADEAQER